MIKNLPDTAISVQATASVANQPQLLGVVVWRKV